MPTSDARRLADQRDAQQSTGPSTVASKLVSRMNALTQGFRSEAGPVPTNLSDAVAKHEADLIAAYRPATSQERWLLSTVADAAAKLDHCQFMIRAQIDDQADRAELCWEEDRKRAVEEIAARLHKDPARTASRLRETPQGCRWILARWQALSIPLLNGTPWDEAQCDLAAHLMGVGTDLRASYPVLSPEGSADDQAALMCDQADAVENLMADSLEPLDAKEQELARLGFPLRPSREYLRLVRYEARLRRLWTDGMAEFRKLRAEGVAESPPVSQQEPEPLAPQSDPNLDSDPEPTDSEVKYATSKLLAMIAGFAASEDSSPEPALPALPVPPPSTSSPRPSVPLNRRARRAQAAAARKRQAAAR